MHIKIIKLKLGAGRNNLMNDAFMDVLSLLNSYRPIYLHSVLHSPCRCLG